MLSRQHPPGVVAPASRVLVMDRALKPVALLDVVRLTSGWRTVSPTGTLVARAAKSFAPSFSM